MRLQFGSSMFRTSKVSLAVRPSSTIFPPAKTRQSKDDWRVPSVAATTLMQPLQRMSAGSVSGP